MSRLSKREALSEHAAFVLGDGVPRTATEVALAVGRRRIDVEEVLRAERRFLRVPAPRGRSARAQTWVLAADRAGQVGTGRSGGPGGAG